MKLKILGHPHDEVLMMTDSRYKNYKENEDRIILKDGLSLKKNFGETGSVEYYQILIPKQLVNEVLCSLHGEFGRQGRQVYSPGRIETDNRKVPLWSQTGEIPRQIHFIWGSITTNSQDSEFTKQIEIPQI